MDEPDTSITAAPDAIVVLGCPVLEGGRPGAAAERRVHRAAGAFHAFHAAGPGDRALLVVASGGRRWYGEAEADVIALRLVSLGVPESHIVRELCSLSTLENAAYSAEILRANGRLRPAIVTCDWHVPRALACFEWMGFAPTALPAVSPRRAPAATIVRNIRERVRRLFDRRAARAWGPP